MSIEVRQLDAQQILYQPDQRPSCQIGIYSERRMGIAGYQNDRLQIFQINSAQDKLIL